MSDFFEFNDKTQPSEQFGNRFGKLSGQLKEHLQLKKYSPVRFECPGCQTAISVTPVENNRCTCPNCGVRLSAGIANSADLTDGKSDYHHFGPLKKWKSASDLEEREYQATAEADLSEDPVAEEMRRTVNSFAERRAQNDALKLKQIRASQKAKRLAEAERANAKRGSMA